MMLLIKERLDALRTAMQEKNFAAYIIPDNDPHLSEYPSDYWKQREWISGFDGSAGTIVVTEQQAALFTDSRYFLQAEEQLKGSGINLVKMGLPESPSIESWLKSHISEKSIVGINAWTQSVTQIELLKKELTQMTIDTTTDLVATIWENRPSMPLAPFFILPKEITGKDCEEKIEILRREIKQKEADILLLSALDEIAWVFNIRGNDIAYNPVVTSYAIISLEEVVLFTLPEKLTKENADLLKRQGVILADYNKITDYLSTIKRNSTLLLDKKGTNYALYQAIPDHCKIKATLSPANLLKSIKNETEIAGFKKAMIKDGVALTQFLIWLEEQVKTETITEYSLCKTLKEFRAKQDGFVGESFGTIAGYNEHGAIVHYSPSEESAYTLKEEGVLLIDSGGQYLHGTTDITRTIALGTPTAAQKKDFTLVLKGNIALSSLAFPEGTRGCQIDCMAHLYLWQNGLNYFHGTGHGVGHFLNVHEGPQSIRKEENPIALAPGMVTSNEPGLYKEGEYGIRIENMVEVIEKERTPFGQFYTFEPLTLCPIDQSLIDTSLLTKEEISWLNSYHTNVFNKLSSYLNEKEQKWLAEKTKTIIG